MSKEHRKHGVIDQGKYRKRTSKRKCIDREYHVQDNVDVAHKYVRIYCDTNQFPELSFCGPYPKPHESRELSKHYHLCFDPKLGMTYVQFATYHVPVLHVHQCFTKLIFLVFHKKTSTLPTCHRFYLLVSYGLI